MSWELILCHGYRLYILDVDSDMDVHMGLVLISDTALNDSIQLLMTTPEAERRYIIEIIPAVSSSRSLVAKAND